MSAKTSEPTDLTKIEGEIRAAGWIKVDEAPDVCGHDQDADWMHLGDVEREYLNPVSEVMERWHNEHHRFAFKFCDEQPCKDYTRAAQW